MKNLPIDLIAGLTTLVIIGVTSAFEVLSVETEVFLGAFVMAALSRFAAQRRRRVKILRDMGQAASEATSILDKEWRTSGFIIPSTPPASTETLGDSENG